MKAYIKPSVSIEQVKLQAILAGSTGLEDVTHSDEEFGGGTVDSRTHHSIWDDED